MAVVSRRGGRTNGETAMRRHRPALEKLEERLPPGDAVLSGLLAGLWMGAESASVEGVLQELNTSSALLWKLDQEKGWAPASASRRPAPSTIDAAEFKLPISPDMLAQDVEELGPGTLAGEESEHSMAWRPAARLVIPPSSTARGSFDALGATTSPTSSPAAPASTTLAVPPPFAQTTLEAANRPADSGRDGRADTIRVLHNFDEPTGSYPYGDLIRDSAGNFYGSTVTGGDFNAGTVFQMSPTNQGWVYQVLHHFTGGLDGGQPYGGVTFNSEGNLYGTAVIGGTGLGCEEGCGVVYELTPSGGVWTHETIHNFQGGDDGAGPGGPVSFDNFGNLYGMTPIGGAFGIGTVFQLAPQPFGEWTKTTIHDFTGGDDGGAASSGRLLIDVDRNIFGVATVGGANGVGVVFQIEPAPAGTWAFSTLYAFKGQPNDGVFPYSGLVKDEAGNLYGTTYYGGKHDAGVVYVLRPVGGEWKERVLYHFQDGSDGAGPVSTLVFGRNGHLYGTTTEGGESCDCGTIFELAPTPNRFWEERVIHRFSGEPDGAYPYGGFVVGENGKMYGITSRGGADDDGMLYVFKP